MTRWRWTAPAAVRALIATAVLPERASATLGRVVLRTHQRDAVNRIRHAMQRFGGALLADEVGLGKTFTALAAVRGLGRLLVVAPASLGRMWTLALERAGMTADMISFETLSRRDPGWRTYDVVIVDEAHHARNPATHRYARLAALTRQSRVLLLSATPVHNDSADLAAVLALFLGSRARSLTSPDAGACIVRRSRHDVRDARIPGRMAPTWVDVRADDHVLPQLMNLPSPSPPRDGGDGGVLVTLSLVRAWASTEAALRSTLRRRIARSDALGDALAAGRHPTQTELRAWVVGDDATQLAFPELVSEPTDQEGRRLLESIRAHATAARQVLTTLGSTTGGTDDRRCEIIRDIRRRHSGQRIVVFSQFADSVHAMFTRLREDGGVASITANGGWIASGPLTRTQILDRFAPQASSCAPPRRAESIDLLIATDLLSEGLNLQDAAIVIHLDLPWTAARLNQRLGRVWRLGSRHDAVHEYALTPPASADAILQLTEHLRRKAGTAWAAIGDSFSALLGSTSNGTGSDTDLASASPLHARTEGSARAPLDRISAAEETRRVLARWCDSIEMPDIGPTRSDADPSQAIPVASVRAPFGGWIAAIGAADDVRLVVARDGLRASSEPALVLEVVRAADGPACVASPHRLSRANREVDEHVDARRAAHDAGVSDVGSRTRAAVASRIAALAVKAPPHRRPVVSRLAVEARHAVARSRSAGAERLLSALISADAGEDSAGAAEAWLERIIDVATPSAPPNAEGPADAHDRLLALLLLVPADGG